MFLFKRRRTSLIQSQVAAEPEGAGEVSDESDSKLKEKSERLRKFWSTRSKDMEIDFDEAKAMLAPPTNADGVDANVPVQETKHAPSETTPMAAPVAELSAEIAPVRVAEQLAQKETEDEVVIIEDEDEPAVVARKHGADEHGNDDDAHQTFQSKRARHEVDEGDIAEAKSLQEQKARVEQPGLVVLDVSHCMSLVAVAAVQQRREFPLHVAVRQGNNALFGQLLQQHRDQINELVMRLHHCVSLLCSRLQTGRDGQLSPPHCCRPWQRRHRHHTDQQRGRRQHPQSDTRACMLFHTASTHPPQDTPLHNAAFGGNDLVVRLLLENGANVHAVTADGVTPLDLAVRGSPVCFILSYYINNG